MYISSYLFPCVLVTVRFSHQHHRSLFTQHSDCTHRSPAPLSQQSSPLRHTYIHASFNKKKPSFSWASQGTTRRQPLLLRLRYTSRLLLRLCCSIIYTHSTTRGVDSLSRTGQRWQCVQQCCSSRCQPTDTHFAVVEWSAIQRTNSNHNKQLKSGYM